MSELYKGFSTAGSGKKFNLSGIPLIRQDILNSFNIREGSVPGRPEDGTSIWSYVFDPNTPETHDKLKKEIRRVLSLDPRLEIYDVQLAAQHNDIIVNIKVRILPDANIVEFSLRFDEGAEAATIT